MLPSRSGRVPVLLQAGLNPTLLCKKHGWYYRKRLKKSEPRFHRTQHSGGFSLPVICWFLRVLSLERRDRFNLGDTLCRAGASACSRVLPALANLFLHESSASTDPMQCPFLTCSGVFSFAHMAFNLSRSQPLSFASSTVLPHLLWFLSKHGLHSFSQPASTLGSKSSSKTATATTTTTTAKTAPKALRATK